MVIALIQTRMHSTRFPGKCMKVLHGKPMTSYTIYAARQSKLIDHVGIIYPERDKIFPINYQSSCYCYGGSEKDVLERYYKGFNFIKNDDNLSKCKHVVRLTSDCPLLYFYPRIIDKVIDVHLSSHADFTHNRGKKGFPSGLDVEIMKYSTLKYIYNFAKDKSDREHVTLYIKKNPHLFKIREVNSEVQFDCKWSIDTKEDFERVSDIINIIKNERGLL